MYRLDIDKSDVVKILMCHLELSDHDQCGDYSIEDFLNV